jgi:hypothetical protein
MANKTLEKIDSDLNTAKEYVKSAGRRAAGANDKDGARKCSEMEEKIDDLKKDFGDKGR